MFRDESRSPAIGEVRPCLARAAGRHTPLAKVAGRTGLGAAALAALMAATPAAAQPLDCFQWVRTTAAYIIHPHPHPHPHRVAQFGAPHPHPHPHLARHIVHRARPHLMSAAYVRRPIACPVGETAIASPIPGATPPETVQDMIAEIAPPPAAESAAAPASAAERGSDEIPVIAPDLIPPDDLSAAGGPLGAIFPGGAPSTAPSGGLGGGGPPPIIIPIGGGPGAVPEPAAWTLMLAGFGAAGIALRRRARRSARSAARRTP